MLSFAANTLLLYEKVNNAPEQYDVISSVRIAAVLVRKSSVCHRCNGDVCTCRQYAYVKVVFSSRFARLRHQPGGPNAAAAAAYRGTKKEQQTKRFIDGDTS